MVLFQSIIVVHIGPVGHVAAEGITNRSRVGIMSIRRDTLWVMTNDLGSLRRSKRLAASISRFLLEPRINELPIPINRPVEVAPVPMHFDGGFIHVPRDPCSPSSLGSPLLRKHRGKTRLPVSNGRVA
jgi:hypothetical protein